MSGDVKALLTYLCYNQMVARTKDGQRRLRLFACAIVRHWEQELTAGRVRTVRLTEEERRLLGVVEAFGEGQATGAAVAAVDPPWPPSTETSPPLFFSRPSTISEAVRA